MRCFVFSFFSGISFLGMFPLVTPSCWNSIMPARFYGFREDPSLLAGTPRLTTQAVGAAIHFFSTYSPSLAGYLASFFPKTSFSLSLTLYFKTKSVRMNPT